MKLGLALPYSGARAMAEMAQLAEESGWNGCFVGDAIWCEDPMISLAAAAMVTKHIRLGTMILPAPLRRPWKIASESLALDRLSDGRLILGLGAGAVWMGWQSFPDEVTNTQARAEILDETIDILTLLYQGKPFDYDGNHYHIKLTLMDEMHYPPRPVQQPRIPIWVPAILPHKKSLQRILRCDGVFVEKRDTNGQGAEASPDDIRHIKSFVEANRKLSRPFDIVMSGNMLQLDPGQQQASLEEWANAGVTWWIEALWGESVEAAKEKIRRGPVGTRHAASLQV